MREEGYYWVKYGDEWCVKHFNGEHWVVYEDGYKTFCTDDFIMKIDERRIVRDD